ncbi:MAG: 50S ribosomal protein L34 [Planctomycetes bacterium]|nr:50S ribosomal protein L34 [Planctomycetota bacterium]
MSKPNIRNSKTKRAKMVGFRTRMKTRGGRKVLRRHRKIGRQMTPKDSD